MSEQSVISAPVIFWEDDIPSVFGFVSTVLTFPEGLPDDVIMFVDQEFMEGTAAPIWYSGGDWMAFCGVQRTGVTWAAVGTDATHAGTPSTVRTWELGNTGEALEPNTAYTLTILANFSTREYVWFNILGGTINYTQVLTGEKLDYPNNAPFSRVTMTYYCGVMRGYTQGMVVRGGEPKAFFWSVTGGTYVDPDFTATVVNDFSTQTTIGPQPLNGPPVDLDQYTMNLWYAERGEAQLAIVQADTDYLLASAYLDEQALGSSVSPVIMNKQVKKQRKRRKEKDKMEVNDHDADVSQAMNDLYGEE